MAWRVVGKSEDVLTCECCGRKNLKLTVILSSGEGEVYYGRDCAARATRLRRTGAAMEAMAREAQRVADERRALTPIRLGEGEKQWVVESIGNNGASVRRLCFVVGGGWHNALDWARRTYPHCEVNVRDVR